MLSTAEKGENWPKVKTALACYIFLVLVQWPSSYIIVHFSLTLGILLNEWLFLAGLPLLVARGIRAPLQKLFPFRPLQVKSLLLLLVMTFAMVVIVDYLLFLSEKIWPPDPALKAMLERVMTVGSLGDGLWRWFLICLSPAFCEEFFFRGFLQNTLARRWRIHAAWLFSAAAFALIHGVPQYLHLYFLLGLYLSWLMKVSGNLWIPVIAHLINNTWTFVTFVLEKKIPAGDAWSPADSLMLGVSVAVFALASFRFAQEAKNPSPG